MKKKAGSRVTIRDVADAAGVSYVAVSVVLNRKKDSVTRVSDLTRSRILKTAADLGYVPNLAARTLKGYRTSLIAVFTYEKVFPVESANEFYQFFAGIEIEAEKNGFDILILNNRPGAQDLHESTPSRIFGADGAIMIGIDRDDEGIRHLMVNGFSLVFVGRRHLQGAETNWLTFDYRQGIALILNHLNSLGCTRLHYFRREGIQREPQMDRERFIYEIAASSGMESVFTHVVTGPCKDPSYFGIKGGADCIVFDHMDTARLYCGTSGLPGFPDGRPIRSAVFEDDWADTNREWTRFSSERVVLGREAVKLLLEIVENRHIQPVNKLIPLSFIPSRSSLREHDPGI